MSAISFKLCWLCYTMLLALFLTIFWTCLWHMKFEIWDLILVKKSNTKHYRLISRIKYKNQEQYYNNRSNTNLHTRITKFTKFRRGTYYSGIKIFNYLPSNIKCLPRKIKSFSPALKRFLYSNSFYIIK